MDTLWSVLRWVDVIAYGGVVSGVLMHWRHLRVAEWPWFRWFLGVFFAASMYATIEIAVQGLPGGWRLVPLTVGIVGLFVGCYSRPAVTLARKINDRP